MNVLVTGGGGLLGRYIVEQLIVRGDPVSVFARGDGSYYLSNAPLTMPLETLVRMSSAVTTAITALDQSQSVIGLTEYEARSWQG
jgi:uncharacterized protein YbjT (DUF2867 family)